MGGCIALLAAHCRGLDEELDRSEFAAVLRELDARALFARFDADGSGTIDGDELARALASVGRAEFGPAAVKVSAHAACRRRASPGPRAVAGAWLRPRLGVAVEISSRSARGVSCRARGRASRKLGHVVPEVGFPSTRVEEAQRQRRAWACKARGER